MNDAKPTNVRQRVVLLTTLLAVLLYLDRLCLGIMAGPIKDDLRLSDGQMSLLFSVFFWAYAFGQVPAGWLSDRFGPRAMLSLYAVLWSIFTALLGLAHGFLLLLVFRLGVGLAEAGGYPASAGIIMRWVPFARRGLASGLVALGGRVGGALAPYLTALLMFAFMPADPRFGPADLLDPTALSRTLANPGDKVQEQARQAVIALLPPDTMNTTAALMAEDEEATPQQRQQLVDGLNAVLASPHLIEKIDLQDLDVSAEARRLAKFPAAERTPQQTQLLNRLVLEAVFPRALRKLLAASWRPVTYIYGALGIGMALLFWWYLRDRPWQHPGCNAAEIALIETAPPVAHPNVTPAPDLAKREASAHIVANREALAEVQSSQPADDPDVRLPPKDLSRLVSGAFPWQAVLTNSSLWFSSLGQFCTNFGWVAFLVNWLPRYLDEVYNVPVVERGVMASVPFLIGLTGMLAGGWLTDLLTQRHGLYWGRVLPQLVTRFVVLAAYLTCLLCQTPWQLVLLLSAVALATDLGTPAVWAFCQDVGGRHTAAVLGWTNMWGNFGAALSPLLLQPLIARLGWNAVFLACAGAYLLSGLAAFGMDARRRID